MGYVNVGEENSESIDLYYEDHGQGDPILMIHGYPFSGKAWEKEEKFFLDHGYRVITYDRRGFGLSSKPSVGYDYDTFTKDLNAIMRELDLHDVTLVGHSMGSGEVTRYISQFGSSRVKACVLVSPIPPYLLDGVPQKVFDGFKEAIVEDRYAFMTTFLKNFYNLGLMSHGVSEEKLRADFTLGTSASPIAFLKCVDTWTTDFRKDLPKMNVPLMVIQGDKDNILPIDATGKKIPEIVPGCRLEVISGGSHGIPWTHGEEIGKMILDFVSVINSTMTDEDDSLHIH